MGPDSTAGLSTPERRFAPAQRNKKAALGGSGHRRGHF
jgi:hypothetical protein